MVMAKAQMNKQTKNKATGGRKALDADGDGKITGKDLAMLRNKKKKSSTLQASKGGPIKTKMAKGGAVKMSKGGSVMTKMSKGGTVRRGYGMARGGRVK